MGARKGAEKQLLRHHGHGSLAACWKCGFENDEHLSHGGWTHVWECIWNSLDWHSMESLRSHQDVSACAHDYSGIYQAYIFETYLQLLFPPFLHVFNTQTSTTDQVLRFRPCSARLVQEQVRLAEMLSADREDQQGAPWGRDQRGSSVQNVINSGWYLWNVLTYTSETKLGLHLFILSWCTEAYKSYSRGTSPKLSHGTSRCCESWVSHHVESTYLWSPGVGCGFLFSPVSVYVQKEDIWDVHHAVTPSCIGMSHIMDVAIWSSCTFFWLLCVFVGRHWSSKNASKNCCLVMKAELGSPICRRPSGGGIFYLQFTHCNAWLMIFIYFHGILKWWLWPIIYTYGILWLKRPAWDPDGSKRHQFWDQQKTHQLSQADSCHRPCRQAQLLSETETPLVVLG